MLEIETCFDLKQEFLKMGKICWRLSLLAGIMLEMFLQNEVGWLHIFVQTEISSQMELENEHEKVTSHWLSLVIDFYTFK